MFDEILACLDGSQLAQEILPLAHGITAVTSTTLTLIRVVADAAELAAEESFDQRKKAKTKGVVAIRAVAHKLCRASYYIMRDRVPFDVTKAFGQK
jgi:hypothetical protein